MIPLREMRLELEKEAGLGKVIAGVAKASGKGLENTVKFILNKPGTALAITGGSALVLGAGALATGAGKHFHDVYNITSEMRKRKVIQNQMMPTLREIAKNTKPEAPPAMPRKQKIILPPLS